MEQLYPQNIIERRYPILRERREKEEREAVSDRIATSNDAAVFRAMESYESSLYANEPAEAGSVGQTLNTLA